MMLVEYVREVYLRTISPIGTARPSQFLNGIGNPESVLIATWSEVRKATDPTWKASLDGHLSVLS